MQELEHVLEFVDVVGHQRDDLTGGLLLQTERRELEDLAVQRTHQTVAHADAEALHGVILLRLAQILHHARESQEQGVVVEVLVGGAAGAARRPALQRLDDEAEEHRPAEQSRLGDGVEAAGVDERAPAAHEARADQRGLLRVLASLLRPVPVELEREVLAVQFGEVAQILGLEPANVPGADERGDVREEHLLPAAGRYPPLDGIAVPGRHDGGGFRRARYDTGGGLHRGILLNRDNREGDIRGGHLGLAFLGAHPRPCGCFLPPRGLTEWP